MRILVTTTHQAIVGGVETYLQALLPALQAQGHDLALLIEVPAGPSCPNLDAGLKGVPVWSCHEGTAEALRQVRAWCPEVVYLQGLQDPFLETGLVDTYPSVLFAHDYHGTCVSGNKRHAWPRLSPCQRPLGPGCLLAYFPRHCGGRNPLTLVRLYRLQCQRLTLLQRMSAVVVASRHMAEEFRRNGIPDQRVHLVPYFPPDVEPDPTPPEARPLSGRVLMIGRLTELKGGRLLVQALHQAQDLLGHQLTLMVAGDGPERLPMAEAAGRLGLQAEFCGWVGSEKRTTLLRQADLLAVPSVWPEPFGIVGLEAGCVGVPAVGFGLGGLTDWLLPGESGELAPADPPTPAGLAGAIARALGDQEHLAHLRKGAWHQASLFNRNDHVQSLERVLAGAAASS